MVVFVVGDGSKVDSKESRGLFPVSPFLYVGLSGSTTLEHLNPVSVMSPHLRLTSEVVQFGYESCRITTLEENFS